MGSHPINLAIRFLLEIAALLIFGLWGWGQSGGVLRFIFALGVPLLAAVLWGTFAVPDDPSRSGKAPIPIPGAIRLVLELAFFWLAVRVLFNLDFVVFGWVFSAAVIIHYGVSYDRIRWLIGKH